MIYYARCLIYLLILCTFLLGCRIGIHSDSDPDTSNLRFQKIQIDSVFRSEAVIAADINNDGLFDIVLGDVWYKAPDWDMISIRRAQAYVGEPFDEAKKDEGLQYYSNSFAVFTDDLNGDGWQDVIPFPSMGQTVYWYENPHNDTSLWQTHVFIEDYHGESPIQVDLFDDGRPGILCGVNDLDSLYQLGYVQKQPDHSISTYIVGHTDSYSFTGPFWGRRIKQAAAGAFAHGLGTGDINRDGILDIMTRNGWYEGPTDGRKEHFDFHPIPFDTLAEASHPNLQFAHMLVSDIDGDGDADIWGSSAHRYGIWWFEQVQTDGHIDFIKHTITTNISQVHSQAMADINHNGRADIITGKRYLAHNGNDPGWDDPLQLLRIEAKQKPDEIEFLIQEIDIGVGVGTQIDVVDMNGDGRIDILVSNKKGTYLFLVE